MRSYFVSEESLAHCVCLLLLELQLCMHQPDKTLALVTYVENQFVVSTDSVISSEKEIKSLEKEHKEMKVHWVFFLDVCRKIFRRRHADLSMLVFVFWVVTPCVHNALISSIEGAEDQHQHIILIFLWQENRFMFA